MMFLGIQLISAKQMPYNRDINECREQAFPVMINSMQKDRLGLHKPCRLQ